MPTGPFGFTVPAVYELTLGRKYKSGAVGSLLHGTVLHGVDYSIELEVYCDGVSLLVDACIAADEIPVPDDPPGPIRFAIPRSPPPRIRQA